MSMSDEEYTHDLARRVRPVIEDLFGPVSDEQIVNVISQALFTAAADVRAGRIAKLEHIGRLLANTRGGVNFIISPDLQQLLNRSAA